MQSKKEKQITALVRREENLKDYLKMMTSSKDLISEQIKERKVRKKFKGSDEEYLKHLIKCAENDIQILKERVK